MTETFRPIPLLSNPHVQTLLGWAFRGPPLAFPFEWREVPLPDGDRLALYDCVPPSWRPGDRVVLLVHGLGGSHQSGYMTRLSNELLPHGLRVVRMDLRGCGGGIALARRSYHGGCSDDVRAAAAAVTHWCPGSPLTLLGFSLGGNIVLKLAGEAADRPVPNLERVAAVSPPIDMAQCSALLQRRANRFYEVHFLRGLTGLIRRRQEFFPDLPAVTFPRRLTLRLFDDLYTAPAWGFADAADYYRRASALPYLARTAVPALLLTARDDPFIAVGPFDSLPPRPNLAVEILPRGGHLGFLAWEGRRGVRWAERRMARWVLQNGRGGA